MSKWQLWSFGHSVSGLWTQDSNAGDRRTKHHDFKAILGYTERLVQAGPVSCTKKLKPINQPTSQPASNKIKNKKTLSYCKYILCTQRRKENWVCWDMEDRKRGPSNFFHMKRQCENRKPNMIFVSSQCMSIKTEQQKSGYV